MSQGVFHYHSDFAKMTRARFELAPGYPDEKPANAGKLSLESHALDRSAIAPLETVWHRRHMSISQLEV